ncbi:MSEP-CTERM sorting domain-containing protein [Thalassotalea sp. PS06]|uniref:MSEP-CTERM sorting domain-containing protein n=1 Tax=Thalassotalea sp. PS06 TaxID=2594005 RepID=UPI001162AAF1|nr:MSEP-CTERM sorting domain-containing protein [Thalassotalea sp. PS06]QDP02306.1 MSEP-CTERM sorting domain-containing protein [Thalassotalea sp. PS06]
MKPKTISHVLFHVILWAMVLPQLSLIGLNLYSWQLIGEEANMEERRWALVVLCLQIGLLTGTLVAMALQLINKVTIGWKIQLVSLAAHVSYMIFFVATLSDIIPNSIQPWILNEGNVGRWTITLLMPGAFISLYALTRATFSKIKTTGGAGSLIVLSLAMPLLWYAFVVITQPAWLGQLSVVITITLSVIMVTLFLGAIIRLCDKILIGNESGVLYKNHYAVATIFGLIMPILGLALNIQIPFPADLQTPIIYVLAIGNGAILLLKPGMDRFTPQVLFLRFLCLPFTVYFFLVFLPFLPLSLLAIIAMGAGFLMLTPLALGIFQARVTYSEFTTCRTKIGSMKTAIIAVCGFLIIPGYLLVQANLDKKALHTSLDYFYSHDMQSDALSASEMERAANALVQLRNRKQNAQLPYISGSYNKIVFGDMVLTDKKIESMYQLLTGEKIAEAPNSITSRQNSSRRTWLTPPSTDTSVQSMAVIDKGTTKKTLKLTLRNHSDDTHSLYRESITIPKGVFVSGLRLKIGDTWEDGQIFDKKTAIWVFEKITEVRRDPALIYYSSPETLDFRVYPFPKQGIREVEVDFTYHPASAATITLGDQELALTSSNLSGSIVDTNNNAISMEQVSQFAFLRKPYLHFILDYGASNAFTASDFAKRIFEIQQQFDIDSAKISAANISLSSTVEISELSALTTEQLAQEIKSISLARAGGFWQQQALAKLFIDFDKNLKPENLNQVPVFISISDKPTKLKNIDLSAWQSLIPDFDKWYEATPDKVQAHPLSPINASVNQELSLIYPLTGLKRVLILTTQDGLKAVATDTSSLVGDMSLTPEFYSPATKRFVFVQQTNKEYPATDDWQKYASLWLEWERASTNPSLLESKRTYFLNESKNHGLVLPTTSLIVVESASQWEMLKRKEKQSLNNHSGLEFENETDASEPAAWILLLLFAIIAALKPAKIQRYIGQWRIKN